VHAGHSARATQTVSEMRERRRPSDPSRSVRPRARARPTRMRFGCPVGWPIHRGFLGKCAGRWS